MNRRLRVLLATPDYPPATGGIQTLLHGIVTHSRDVDYDVLTLNVDRTTTSEPGVRRIGRLPGPHTASVAWLNAHVLGAARRGGYDAVLCGHIVVAPAVMASRRPWAQYVYAKELAHRPRLASTALKRADRVVAISRHTEEMAIAAGAAAARIRLIPPGIPLPDAAAAARRNPDDATVLTISRLDDAHKGTDVLIEAIAIARRTVSRVRLVVVGDGVLRQGLQTHAERLGVADAVTFLGRVDDAERDHQLDTCAVFSMLSRVPPGGGGEGFGIVFAEAAARGVPVIAGDAGGARDAIDRDRTGLLVDPLFAEEAAAAIVRLLDDRPLRLEFGVAGRGWAKRFAWEAVTRDLEAALVEAAV